MLPARGRDTRGGRAFSRNLRGRRRSPIRAFAREMWERRGKRERPKPPPCAETEASHCAPQREGITADTLRDLWAELSRAMADVAAEAGCNPCCVPFDRAYTIR